MKEHRFCYFWVPDLIVQLGRYTAKDFFFILLVLENLPEQSSSKVIEKLYVLLNLVTWLRRFTLLHTDILSLEICHKFSHAKSCSSHLRKIIRPIRIAKDVIARVINMIRPIKSRRNSQRCVSFAPKFSQRPLFGSCLAEIQREEKWISFRKLEGKKFSISPSWKKEPANYSRRRRKLKLYVNL